MKLSTLLLTAALSGMAMFSAAAADLKVAVLDSQMVFNQTNAAKRAVESLKKSHDDAQKKIDALDNTLVTDQKKLAEQQKVLAPDKFAQAQADFQKKVGQFRSQAQTIQEGWEKQGLDMRKKIADAVKQVVEKIAKERGYDLVLPKNLAFYTGTNVPDISTEVLSQANATLDK